MEYPKDQHIILFVLKFLRTFTYYIFDFGIGILAQAANHYSPGHLIFIEWFSSKHHNYPMFGLSHMSLALLDTPMNPQNFLTLKVKSLSKSFTKGAIA